jgi:DNA replication protein DnaC
MTIENHLAELRLHGMHRHWNALSETRRHLDLSLSDGLELLLHAELEDRQNRRFDRLVKNAHFRYQASIAELHADTAKGMDKTLLARLATGDYLNRGESILISGPTGVGKSFLASALGNHACIQGFSVAYYSVQKLMLKIKMARAEGTLLKFFDKLAKVQLLILDDFGLSVFNQQQCLDIMEISEDRHGRKSTIVASQLPVGSWYDLFSEVTIADAILDRLIHSSHRFELKGESLRKKL